MKSSKLSSTLDKHTPQLQTRILQATVFNDHISSKSVIDSSSDTSTLTKLESPPIFSTGSPTSSKKRPHKTKRNKPKGIKIIDTIHVRSNATSHSLRTQLPPPQSASPRTPNTAIFDSTTLQTPPGAPRKGTDVLGEWIESQKRGREDENEHKSPGGLKRMRLMD